MQFRGPRHVTNQTQRHHIGYGVQHALVVNDYIVPVIVQANTPQRTTCKWGINKQSPRFYEIGQDIKLFLILQARIGAGPEHEMMMHSKICHAAYVGSTEKDNYGLVGLDHIHDGCKKSHTDTQKNQRGCNVKQTHHDSGHRSEVRLYV